MELEIQASPDTKVGLKKFSDLGIKVPDSSFSGDKIRIDRILNKDIRILDYKVGISQYEKGSGKLLTLSINVDNEPRIVFSGSTNLINTLELIPKADFPFLGKIVKGDNRLEFA